MWTETAETIDDGGCRLRGMLHRPGDGGWTAGLVVCPPVGEERKSSARVLTRAARLLCAAGCTVLRFDYRGTGESDGCLETVSLADWVEDIRRAMRHLSAVTGVDRVGVLGVRFGAALAAMVSVDDGPLPVLVCWAPVWTGRWCLVESLRHLAATRLAADDSGGLCDRPAGATEDGSIDIGSGWVRPSLRRELEGLELPRDARATAVTVVVRHFSRQSEVVAYHHSVGERLTCPGGEGRVLYVPGRPFWVTASRYDPQPLVEATVETIVGEEIERGSSVSGRGKA